jgi:hypothetical protein
MADEPSTEAVVAGEAAAAAVEEVQARQEIDAAATEAILTADVALAAASEAEQTTAVAIETSVMAIDSATEAQVAAEQAQESVATVAYMTQEAFTAQNAATDEKLREMREYIDSRIPLPIPESTPAVEEVEVGHGTAVSDSHGRSESAGAGEAGSEAESAQKRYGLKHRKK